MPKVCDYSGFTCLCVGFKQAIGTQCICGHYYSQHPTDDVPEITQKILADPERRRQWEEELKTITGRSDSKI